MGIYITGDCHADFHRFNKEQFPAQKGLSKEDYMIVAGDFGGYWDASPEQKWWNKWLSDRPFRTLFLDGNHENFMMLAALPVFSWKGGKVQQIPGTDILHLMRGQMYEIDGCRIFSFGGARSHDISEGIIPYDEKGKWRETARLWARRGKRMFRIDQVSWWEEEMPSGEEMEEGRRTMEANGWQCDYIITHDCPASTLRLLYQDRVEANALNEYLEELRGKAAYQKWYFGHHHQDMAVSEKEIMLYEKIVQIW